MKRILSVVIVLSILLLVFQGGAAGAQANESVAQSRFFSVEASYFDYVVRPNSAAQGDYNGAVQAIGNAVTAAAASVNISAYSIPTSQISGLLINDIYQNPLFFYLSGFSYSYNTSTNIVINVFFTYYYDASVIQQMKVNYEAAVARALAVIQTDMTNAEKALSMHDYLILAAKYDYENQLANTVPPASNTAYGVLVNGAGVCNGYALAYKDLLTRLNVPVIKVNSDSMSHAWNMVYLDSKWYHVDVTWDDPICATSNGWLNNDYDLEGRVEHMHFLLSDTALTNIGHSGWLPNTNIANSTLYDGDYTNIKSGMLRHQGYWYYNKNGKLTRSLLNLSGSSDIKTINGVDNTYSYLGVFYNEVYYNFTPSDNSKSEIRKCKFDGSGDTQVLLINNAGQTVKEKITELVIRDNQIKYTVYRWPASGSAQYAVRYLTLTPPAGLAARENSATVINPENNFIFGLKTGLTQTEFENDFVAVTGDATLAYTPANGVLGTGTKAELIDSATSEVLETYTIIIFGDLNGDGSIDSIDAGIVVDVENYVIDWQDAADACYILSADINGDDNIDSLDAGLVVDAENYLVTVNQVTGLAG